MNNTTNATAPNLQALDQPAPGRAYPSYDAYDRMPWIRPSSRIIYFQAPRPFCPVEACTPIDPRETQYIWNAFKDAAWMLDVILLDVKEGTLRQPNWNRFFKTPQYQDLGVEIFTLVRNFIDSFLRYDDNSLLWDVRIARISMPEPSGGGKIATTTVASTTADKSKFDTVLFCFHDLFFQDKNSLDDFFLMQLEPYHVAERMSCFHASKTIIHEVVHLVSRHASWTQSPFGPFCCLNPMVAMPIYDVGWPEVANPFSSADLAIVSKWPFPTQKSYGNDACEALAKLEYGDLGALHNADSYAEFINDSVLTHLSELTAGPEHLPPIAVREDIRHWLNAYAWPSYLKSFEPDAFGQLPSGRPMMARLLLHVVGLQTLDFIQLRRNHIRAIMKDDVQVRRVPVNARLQKPFFYGVISSIPPYYSPSNPAVTFFPPYVARVDPWAYLTPGAPPLPTGPVVPRVRQPQPMMPQTETKEQFEQRMSSATKALRKNNETRGVDDSAQRLLDELNEAEAKEKEAAREEEEFQKALRDFVNEDMMQDQREN